MTASLNHPAFSGNETVIPVVSPGHPLKLRLALPDLHHAAGGLERLVQRLDALGFEQVELAGEDGGGGQGVAEGCVAAFDLDLQALGDGVQRVVPRVTTAW